MKIETTNILVKVQHVEGSLVTARVRSGSRFDQTAAIFDDRHRGGDVHVLVSEKDGEIEVAYAHEESYEDAETFAYEQVLESIRAAVASAK